MQRSLLALVLSFAVSGCDCGDVSVSIIEPADATTFNLASDVDAATDGVQIVVLVATEGIDLGTSVALRAGDQTYHENVKAGGVATFPSVTLAEGPNELSASADGEKSKTVTVTLDSTITECPNLSISVPQDGAILKGEDDEDGEACGQFTYTVVAATTAQDGRTARLLDNEQEIATAEVAGAEIRFEAVVLNSGANDLQVALDGPVDCSAAASVTVDCGVTCSITDPHDDPLNASLDSSPGEPGFQTDVVVSTDGEDGTQVDLSVDDGADSQSAAVQGGLAEFADVSLAEGERTLQATCRDEAGNVATSARVRFLVDSVLPNVSIREPAEGASFNMSQDADGDPDNGLQVRVCATASEDGDFCAQQQGADPGDAGCADAQEGVEVCGLVDCNGAGITLEAEVTDRAGNVATETRTVNCYGGVPVIRIIDPTAGTSFSSADDTAAGTPGFQHDVVVCTDANADVSLYMNGASIATVPVVAQACDGLDYTATFNDFTFAEGDVTLEARVAGLGGNGTSPQVSVFVDSLAPSLTLQDPACGAALGSLQDTDAVAAGIQHTLTGIAVGLPAGVSVDGTLTNSDGVTNLSDVPAGGGFVDFGTLTFRQGDNTLHFTLIDAVGNSFTLDCVVTGNEGGYLEITSPLADHLYRGAGDQNPGVPGYQGAVVQVRSDSPTDNSVCVQVYAGAAPVGSCTNYNNANGISISVDLPEGADPAGALVLHAETRGHALPELVSGNVPIQVDTLNPTIPGGLSFSVIDLRAGTIELRFTAPEDPVGRTVTGYNVRRKSSPFVGENDGSLVGNVGAIVAPGAQQTLTVTNIPPGRRTYFAVRGADAVGNTGLSSVGAVDLDFRTQTVESPVLTTDQNFGIAVAGGGDVNADGFDDVVVGPQDIAFPAPNRADVYFGDAGGLSSTPDVSITSSDGFSFGFAVAMLDFNGDGDMDVAVGDYYVGGAGFDHGAVYVFFGGPGLGANLTTLDADVTITGAAGEYLGAYLANAGDVDHDGDQDLLVSGMVFGPMDGEVYLVLGRGPDTITLPGERDLLITGPATGGRFGGAIGPAGDLNGDGNMDFVIGSCRADLVGSAYVFLGQGAAAIAADPDRTSADASLIRTGAGSDLGYGCAVAGVGDVTGDLSNDLVVGMPNLGPSGRGGFVLYPGDGLGGLGAGLTFTNDNGPNPSDDNLGIAIAATTALTAGATQSSVDPSGFTDLAVGQYRYSEGAGRVTFYWGGPGFAAGDVLDASGYGYEPGDGSGLLSMAYAGDVNGDSWVDFILGDPNASAGGTARAGRVYLVY